MSSPRVVSTGILPGPAAGRGRELTASPSVLFFPLADVDNEQYHKDEEYDASSTNAKDEDDIQTFPCKRNSGWTEGRGPRRGAIIALAEDSCLPH